MQPCKSIVPAPCLFNLPLCASNDANSIHTLPPEVIQQLFTHFRDVADFCTLSETCKRMYTIASHIPVYSVCTIRSGLFDTLSGFAFLRNHDARNSAQQLAVAISLQDSLDNQPCQAIQEKEEAFYKTFKQCCFRPNAKIIAEIAKICLIANFATERVMGIYSKYPCHFRLAVDSNLRLYQKFCDDLIDTMVEQFTETTLCADFKPNANILSDFVHQFSLNRIPLSYIEQILREAIRAKYQTILESKAIEFSKATLTSPLVAQFKEQQTRDLLARKAEIESEMLQLRGPSNFNGRIHDAYMKSENLLMAAHAAERERNQVDVELQDRLNRETFTSYCVYSAFRDDALARFRAADYSFTDFRSRASRACVKHSHLCLRLNTLAQWQPGTDTLIGGELFEVNNKLQCINDNKLALKKAQLLGQFYKELATPVTDANKQERYDSLKTIYDELAKIP